MAVGVPPASVAGYPVRIEHLRCGTLALRLLLIDALERYVDRDALLRDAAAAEPPYWAHLWTASRALAGHLAPRDNWNGKRIIDIGCGLGLLSVIAALKGADVTAIDTAADAIALARANVELNGCHVTALQADLRQVALGPGFDYCFAADVTYDPNLQHALAAFLDRHLAADGIGWCAESVRTHDTGFRHACEATGLQVSEVELSEIEEDRPVIVRVSEVTRSGVLVPPFQGGTTGG